MEPMHSQFKFFNLRANASNKLPLTDSSPNYDVDERVEIMNKFFCTLEHYNKHALMYYQLALTSLVQGSISWSLLLPDIKTTVKSYNQLDIFTKKQVQNDRII